jgi:hypothetical protein
LSPEVQRDLQRLSENGFDIILTDPPLGHRLTKPIEIEYIKAILEQLKLGGNAAILLPESTLSISRYREIRELLFTNAHILGVISLPASILDPLNNMRASVVIFSKKESETPNKATLFLKIPDELKQTDVYEVCQKAAETFHQFYKTKKLNKNISIQLAPSISKIDQHNGYRMDHLAYAPEYIRAIEHLKKIDAEIVSFGDIAKIRLGYLHNTKIPSGVPIISLRELKDGWFDSLHTNPAQTQVDLYEFTDILLKPGDLLISSILVSDTPVFMVPQEIQPTFANRSLIVMTPNRERVLPGYLFALFENELIKIQIKRLSIGSTTRSVTPRLLSEIQIPLISLQKQNQIADYIGQYYEFQKAAKGVLNLASTVINQVFEVNDEDAENENS